MLKNRRWLWLPLLALVPLSSARASGLREGKAQGHDVQIVRTAGTSVVTGTAWGALGTVRLEPLAAYQEKQIGCYLDAAVGVLGPSVLVRCEADTPNDWLYCVSNEPTFVSAVSAMNGDSEITFTAADGVCTQLRVDNNSKFQQKAN